MTLAIEDANSKLVDVVVVADIDVERRLVTALTSTFHSLARVCNFFFIKAWHLFWLSRPSGLRADGSGRKRSPG